MDEHELRAFFNEHGPAWIAEQEARFRAIGQPLPNAVAQGLAPFFGPALDEVRISSDTITNPPWYPDLRARGADERDFLDFARVEAITFNTVANISPGAQWTWPLLFHELVHVVQYRLLGVEEFARRYVDGWFAARLLVDKPQLRYFSIPLERQAFDLQNRYAGAPTSHFSVEAAVRGGP